MPSKLLSMQNMINNFLKLSKPWDCRLCAPGHHVSSSTLNTKLNFTVNIFCARYNLVIIHPSIVETIFEDKIFTKHPIDEKRSLKQLFPYLYVVDKHKKGWEMNFIIWYISGNIRSFVKVQKLVKISSWRLFVLEFNSNCVVWKHLGILFILLD